MALHISQEQLLAYIAKRAQRYAELEAQMADQASSGTSAVQAYSKISKELAALRQVVSAYRNYQRLEKEYQESQVLLKAGGDPEMVALAKEEVALLEQKQAGLIQSFQQYWLTQHQEPDRALIMEIRAGTGGNEASLFAADLYRMYTKYAASHQWKVQLMHAAPSEAGGFKEVVFAVNGEGAWRHLKYESGVHRVQRVPVTEAAGRIHTSTATVAVLQEPEEVELPPIPAKDLQIDVYRASGPGGQGVNTTDSAVRIHHLPTGIIVTCQDERSQLQNREAALRVLRARLLDKLQQDQKDALASDRRQQVGTGERSEKIRTYNFPDRRVTDHRIGVTLHKLDAIMEGELNALLEQLIAAEQHQWSS